MTAAPGAGKPRPIVAPPFVFYGPPWAPRGLWLRSRVESLVPCPDARCEAARLEPCKVQGHGRSFIHNARRRAYKEKHGVLGLVTLAAVVRIQEVEHGT